MKVYILSVGHDYQSSDFLGVYSSLDLADRARVGSNWHELYDYAEIHETDLDSGDVLLINEYRATGRKT